MLHFLRRNSLPSLHQHRLISPFFCVAHMSMRLSFFFTDCSLFPHREDCTVCKCYGIFEIRARRDQVGTILQALTTGPATYHVLQVPMTSEDSNLRTFGSFDVEQLQKFLLLVYGKVQVDVLCWQTNRNIASHHEARTKSARLLPFQTLMSLWPDWSDQLWPVKWYQPPGTVWKRSSAPNRSKPSEAPIRPTIHLKTPASLQTST